MRFCLDTNTCIDAMKDVWPGMRQRFERQVPDDFGVPAMVRAELLLGAFKSKNAARTQDVVESFLAPFELLPFDRLAAGHNAEIRHDLECRGQCIGPNDLIIAAIARCRNLILITHNRNEFGRVTGLMTEDWALPAP